MKQLLNISTYKFTGDFIGEIKKENGKYYEKFLPKYCLNDSGHITMTYYYLQFIENGKEEYRLFDINHTDFILKEEISNVGIDEIFETTDLRKIFDLSNPLTSDKYYRTFPNNFSIIIDVNFYGEGEDTEVEFKLLGYLDEDMNFIKI